MTSRQHGQRKPNEIRKSISITIVWDEQSLSFIIFAVKTDGHMPMSVWIWMVLDRMHIFWFWEWNYRLFIVWLSINSEINVVEECMKNVEYWWEQCRHINYVSIPYPLFVHDYRYFVSRKMEYLLEIIFLDPHRRHLIVSMLCGSSSIALFSILLSISMKIHSTRFAVFHRCASGKKNLTCEPFNRIYLALHWTQKNCTQNCYLSAMYSQNHYTNEMAATKRI